MRSLVPAMWGITMLGALAACQTAAPDQVAVEPDDLPPIAKDYRAQIAGWARRFYAEPASLRATRISDPVLIRDRSGRLLWLVCIEADARTRGGGYMGVERQAIGFAPNYLSAPLERNRSTLIREDCDAQPLVWRPWQPERRL